MAKTTKARTEEKGKTEVVIGSKLSAEQLQQIAERLERGEVGIREAGQAFGFKSGAPLRNALREMLGEDGYQRIIAAGRTVRGIPEIGVAARGKAKKPAEKKASRHASKRS